MATRQSIDEPYPASTNKLGRRSAAASDRVKRVRSRQILLGSQWRRGICVGVTPGPNVSKVRELLAQRRISKTYRRPGVRTAASVLRIMSRDAQSGRSRRPTGPVAH